MKARRLVVVVEDEPLVAEAISAWLQLGGNDVHIMRNGYEALSAIEQLRPCVVLLDLHLPLMNGRTLVQKMREEGLHIPVVVVTADPHGREVAAEIGAVAFVRKAFDLPRLLLIVDEVCADTPGSQEPPRVA